MPKLHLITPALADANNGNWQTAYRWSRFLSDRFDVITAKSWEPDPKFNATSASASVSSEMMIALHARRSAPSIAAFSETGQPVIVVMTGTDLYRDIHNDPGAQHSLELADRLVVLHEQGIQDLPTRFQSKARVIFQSARRLSTHPSKEGHSSKRFFDIALVGHIRPEKDPMTALRAIQAVQAIRTQTGAAQLKPVRLIHIGSDKDEALGKSFRELAQALPAVQLKGSLSNAKTRQIIKRCDVLVLPSIMEGGANVLIEAVMSGVPVLASRISGSVGMLGQDYLGYFSVGNEQELAELISQCRNKPEFLRNLSLQCELRSTRFEPLGEKQALNAVVAELLPPQNQCSD